MKLILAFLGASVAFAQTATFPAAVTTDAQLKIARNRVQTTLRGTISASDTIITVSDATRIEANMLLTIDSEIVSVTSVSGNNLTVVRGFDSTTAASHSSGRTVSHNAAAWNHNAMAAEVKAIQTALGANLSNIAGGSPVGVTVTQYDWTQTPGGSLIVGVNVVTLTPCPTGVAGANADHYVYLSGGVGTAEAALIVGGTCTSGAPTGTIIFTAANTHSGAYTVSSASDGIREAWTVAGSNSSIFLPPGTYNIYAPLVLTGSNSVIGASSMSVNLVRQFSTGSVMKVIASPSQGLTIAHLGFTVGASISSSTEYFLHVENVASPFITDIHFIGKPGASSKGIYLKTLPRAIIEGIYCLNCFESVRNAEDVGLVASNIITSGAETNAITWVMVGGLVYLSNFSFQEVGSGSTRCIAMIPDIAQASYVADSVISNGSLDGCQVGILKTGTGFASGVTVQGLRFTGPRILLALDAQSVEWNISDSTATGCFESNGCIQIAGSLGVSVHNVDMYDAATAGALGYKVSGAARNISIRDSLFGYSGIAPGAEDANAALAVSVEGTAARVHFSGNKFAGTTAAYSVTSSGADITIDGANPGVPFTSLYAAWDDGSRVYCTDCAPAAGTFGNCAGSGSGAMAMKLAGVWRCLQ